MTLKLLRFAPTDFPWRFKSLLKLHQIPKKIALCQKYRTGKPTQLPTQCILLSPTFTSPERAAPDTRYVSTSCVLPSGLRFEWYSVYHLHFPLSVTCLLSFLRHIFRFSEGCLFSTNKTFILVCLITPALLSPF